VQPRLVVIGRRASVLVLSLVGITGLAGFSSVGASPSPDAAGPATSTTTTTIVPPTTTVGPTAVAPPTTTVAAPATSVTATAPPVDLLVGIDWIQRAYASPCGERSVQLVGGSAVENGALVVLDDIVALTPTAGLAVAFLSCRTADGSTTQTTAVVVQIKAGSLVNRVERELGAGARVVDLALPTFVVETPEGAVPSGSCCAPFVRRRGYRVDADSFTITADDQLSAFAQTVSAAAPVGDDVDLVRSGVPAAALCYQWDNVYLTPVEPATASDTDAEPPAITAPTAELQTARLALIRLTGQWIDPTSQMTPQMSAVVTSYQQKRGLAVDGTIGAETSNALQTDLGCPAAGSFNQVDPPQLGPRHFAAVPELLAYTQRYAGTGASGNPSLDALLRAAGWDGTDALFLGCARRDIPDNGVTCSWSGTTPLQLVGLADDINTPGVAGFSVLYARSAPPG